MSVYGYHRTSTREQHLDRGINAIEKYCKGHDIELNEMFKDQQTGKNFDRPDYKAMKRIIKSEDILILSELDRLGRNKQDTLKELSDLKNKGVRVMILEIPTTLTDYKSLNNDELATMLMETVNNMLIEMYATLAHAEMNKKAKRQQEGIQAKKERGDWSDYGRPSAIEWKTFVQAYEKVVKGEVRPFDCMRNLGMTKPTFYRYARKYKNKELIN